MPLVEPSRTVPVGLVTVARDPGSVMARALAEVARGTDVAAAWNAFREIRRRGTCGGPRAVGVR
ncbi:hypothetical protein ACFXGT_02790 [Streptomyces sp. NPDC059352]|uniref:hypothetical protein n=1 Tax=Streptomyces sp. NPDC059352 TaxID=3346810 RepID=UPI003682E50A